MKTFLILFSTVLVISIIYTLSQLYSQKISLNYGFLIIATLSTFLYMIILSLKRINKK